MVKKKCLTCNKEIKEKGNRKYCSRNCFLKGRQEYNKKYSRDWRKTHTQNRDYRKDRDKQIHKKWREKNKMKLRNYFNKWKSQNKEKYLELVKKWREINQEKQKENIKKWKFKNRERLKEQSKLWRLENQEKVLAHRLTKDIKIPKNFKCMICHKQLAKSKHHLDYSNPYEVLFVCNKCHYFLNRNKEKLKS